MTRPMPDREDYGGNAMYEIETLQAEGVRRLGLEISAQIEQHPDNLARLDQLRNAVVRAMELGWEMERI